MAKTYTAAGTVAAGDVATAAAWNVVTADINNLIVPPAVRLTRGSTQSIATATDTFVTWPTEVYDTDGVYTATSDTITLQTAGIYIVTVSIAFAANNTGARIVNIYKNPSSVSDFGAVFASVWSNATQTYDSLLSTSGAQSFAAAETIKVGVFQTSGGALNIGSVGFPAQTHISATWIGRTS